jgi:RNA polymerase sigma factor, sigma-70 family
MNNYDLAKIVKKVQSNKEKYFELLFNEIHRTIYYLSFKFLNNEEEAQDVSQEIIFSIYSRIEELKIPEGFNSWMNQIIFSKCKNRLKKLSRRKEADYKEDLLEEEQSLEDNPEGIVQTKEKNELVLGLIDTLPLKQKEVILLYYYQQLTIPEIAKVLSCSISAIKNRLYNAKKSIQERIEKVEDSKSEKLFGIVGIPVLFKLLSQEEKSIEGDTVKETLRNGFANNKKNAKSVNQEISRRKNKTNTVTLCFVVLLPILLLSMTTALVIAYKGLLNKPIEMEDSQKQESFSNGKQEIELQPEEVISSSEEINTIHIWKRNIKENITPKEEAESDSLRDENNVEFYTEEKMNQPVEEKIERAEEPNFKWSLAEVSPDSNVAIWRVTEGEDFTNTAMIEDKELEELTYDYQAGNREKDESVFNQEQYQKDSNITYHTALAPAVSFVKGSSLEEEIITYYLHLENIGEVVAFNLVIKDMIPTHTKFVRTIEEQVVSDIQITTLYEENTERIFWIINQLQPGERVTLVFQVQVEAKSYKNDRTIKNIAYMKIVGKDGDVDNQLKIEAEYMGSNEIIHMMLQEKINPQTGDETKGWEVYILLAILSLGLCIYLYQKRKQYIVKINEREQRN